jgi:hypothetical protein
LIRHRASLPAYDFLLIYPKSSARATYPLHGRTACADQTCGCPAQHRQIQRTQAHGTNVGIDIRAGRHHGSRK